jgi:hypothetical protein
MTRFRIRGPFPLLVAAWVLLATPACRPSETVEGQTHDVKLKTQVKSKLASDIGATTLTSLSVDVTNGVVTLAGPVHSEDEKSRAEAAAKSVDGVVRVNNALQVQAVAPPPSSGMTTSDANSTPGPTSAPPVPDRTP